MDRTVWDYIKEFYKVNHNIPEEILDYIAIYDIAYSSCSGISNEDIAELYKFTHDYVKGILIEFLDFNGWNFTLDMSPILVYNRVNGNRELFDAYMMAVVSLIGRQNIGKAYSICQRLMEIREEIDKAYV